MIKNIVLQKNKIRIAIAAIVFFIFIVAFTSVITAYVNRFKNEMDNENMTHLSEVSDYIAAHMTTVVTDTIQSLETVSSALLVIKSDADRINYLESIMQQYSFAYIGYAMLDGELHATIPSETKNISQEEYFQISIKGKTYVSGRIRKIFKNRSASGIIISVPIGKNNSTGVLVAMLETSRLHDALSLQSFGGDGYSYIIEKDGSLIMRTKSLDFSNLFRFLKTTSFIDGNLDQFKADVKADKPGNIRFVNMGVELYAYYRPLSFNDWIMVNVVSGKTLSAKTFALTRELAIIGGIITSIFMVLIFSAMRSYRISKNSLEATEAKTAFLANMSHEIRTPMNAIVGMSEIMLRDEMSKKQREQLSRILNSSKSLLTIINDILDISKIESGKFNIINAPYEIEAMFHDIISIVSVRIGEKPVHFFIEPDPDLPRMLIGDVVRVKQVLLNIIGNAVKFTKEGYICLSIKLQRKEKNIVLYMSVEDTGIGIKQENLDKLFISFNQVDIVKNHSIEGTGLGLVISKKLCNMMNGDIFVKSEYGKGTTFTISITQEAMESDILAPPSKNEANILICENRPLLINYMSSCMDVRNISYTFCEAFEDFIEQLKDGKYTHALIKKDIIQKKQNESFCNSIKLSSLLDLNEYSLLRPENMDIYIPLFPIQLHAILNPDLTDVTKSILADDNKPLTIEPMPHVSILVVDDNNINIFVAEGLMEPYGMNIHHALSGKDALKIIQEHSFDLILMDHMMPEMDGVETVNIIRNLAESKYKNIPIIALTANATDEARKMFLASGFNGFLSKPIDTRRLHEILIKWLKKINDARAAHKNNNT